MAEGGERISQAEVPIPSGPRSRPSERGAALPAKERIAMIIDEACQLPQAGDACPAEQGGQVLRREWRSSGVVGLLGITRLDLHCS